MIERQKENGKKQNSKKRNINALSGEVGSTLLEEHELGTHTLSGEVGSHILQDAELDTHVMSGIAAEEEWDTEDKIEAIESLSEIESQEDREIALSEMKYLNKIFKP